MADLVRLSITMERDLHEQLQKLLADDPHENRSEFIRALVRHELVQREWERDEEVVGSITLVYRHQQADLNRRLTEQQHDHHDLVLATTHIHLDHDLCAEVVMVRGRASAIQKFANAIRQQRGVVHASLAVSTLGTKIP